MNNFMGQVVVVLTAIISVALVAVLVSKQANTTGVIDSSFGGLSQFLSVAVSPVTGGGTGGRFGAGGLGMGGLQF